MSLRGFARQSQTQDGIVSLRDISRRDDFVVSLLAKTLKMEFLNTSSCRFLKKFQIYIWNFFETITALETSTARSP